MQTVTNSAYTAAIAADSVAEHRAVYAAIASGDAQEAERVMNAHVASARDRLAKSLEAMEKGAEK